MCFNAHVQRFAIVFVGASSYRCGVLMYICQKKFMSVLRSIDTHYRGLWWKWQHISTYDSAPAQGIKKKKQEKKDV